jgi:hypothetical protein
VLVTPLGGRVPSTGGSSCGTSRRKRVGAGSGGDPRPRSPPGTGSRSAGDTTRAPEVTGAGARSDARGTSFWSRKVIPVETEMCVDYGRSLQPSDHWPVG